MKMARNEMLGVQEVSKGVQKINKKRDWA